MAILGTGNKRVFSQTGMIGDDRAPKRIKDNYPVLIQTLFSYVKNNSDTSTKRKKLYKDFNYTTENFSKISSDENSALTCIRVLSAFKDYSDEDLEALAQWISANTLPGLGEQSSGAYPVIKDFFNFVNKCMGNKQIYNLIKEKLIDSSIFTYLKCQFVTTRAFQIINSNRMDIIGFEDVRDIIYNQLAPKTIISLMLSCKKQKKIHQSRMLNEIHNHEEMRWYNIRSFRALSSLLDEKCIEVKRMKLFSTFIMNDDLNANGFKFFNNQFKFVEHLTLDSFVMSSAMNVLKKHPSLRSLIADFDVKSLTFLKGWTKLENLTIKMNKLSNQFSAASYLQNLHITTNEFDLAYLKNFKVLNTLSICTGSISNIPSLVSLTSLKHLTLEAKVDSKCRLPYCEALKYIDVSRVRPSGIIMDWTVWPVFEGKFIDATWTAEGKFIQGIPS